MRILNESKSFNMTIEECDLSKGYLKEEIIKNGDTEELVEIYKLYTQKQLYEKEMDTLKYWFEGEYREKFLQYTRKIALGKKLADGSDPLLKLNQLYYEAEQKEERIEVLKRLINL